MLNERDLLKIQAVLPDYRYELRDGKVVVMTPSGYFSEAVALRLAGRLDAWVSARRLGFVSGSNAGFRLPNGDIVAPDVAYVSKERMRKAPRGFSDAVPEVVVEVKSPSDRVGELEEKLAMIRECGARVAILINPDDLTVTVDEQDIPRRILRDGDELAIPSVLPGWSVCVTDLWPPDFSLEPEPPVE